MGIPIDGHNASWSFKFGIPTPQKHLYYIEIVPILTDMDIPPLNSHETILSL